MKYFSLSLENSETKYVTFPFYKDGRVLEGGVVSSSRSVASHSNALASPSNALVSPTRALVSPSRAPLCGMSVKAAGTMRFRWNETNDNRNAFLKELCSSRCKGGASVFLTPKPVELIHSKLVVDLKCGDEADGKQADGIITKNRDFLPVVTVADCMPLYLYDSVTGVFGVVHSGWKGTGIAGEAIKLARADYGARAEDFCVVIGPHIRDCCYIVNEERAKYFTDNFGSDCVSPLEEGGVCRAGGRGLPVSWNNGTGMLYRLSLEKANLNVLARAGVREENIAVCTDCTCCNELLGSNRRETADFIAKNPGASPEQLSRCFSVQCAFIGAF